MAANRNTDNEKFNPLTPFVMAVIKYTVRENKAVGTHSVFAVPVSYSTLTCEDMKDEVVEGLGVSPDLVPTIIKRYMHVALRSAGRGHRVKLGDELVIYPQISCSVKDELNDDGTVKKVATADMLSVQNAKSSIGATISQAVQQSFAQSVSWKRVTAKDDEETTDTTTDPTDTTDPTTDPDPTNPDDQGGGGTDPNE